LAGARATCSAQGRCFPACPRRAPSRVSRSGRLRLTSPLRSPASPGWISLNAIESFAGPSPVVCLAAGETFLGRGCCRAACSSIATSCAWIRGARICGTDCDVETVALSRDSPLPMWRISGRRVA
jgi:hypothetical protein